MEFLIDITKIQEEYKNRFGHAPLNISDWNPSYEFKERLNTYMQMDYNINPIDYVFSYSFTKSEHQSLLTKLGYENSDGRKETLITPNGSASIRNILHWLHEVGCKKLLVISPSYFTVEYGCSDFDIIYKEIFLRRNSTGYHLNNQEVLAHLDEVDAIWVTNPIYCTSVHFDNNIISVIENILKLDKYVISDESLCRSGYELVRHFGKYKKFVGIYSPHKSICVNGNKFSVIVFDRAETNIFNNWVVALSGNLLISNAVAFNHFQSDNFTVYKELYDAEVSKNYKRIEAVIKKYKVDYDSKIAGYLVSIYFPNIDGNKGYDKLFLKKLVFETGVTLIPGVRNHFDPQIGFCFRINLCSLTKNTVHSLIRLIKYLQQY